MALPLAISWLIFNFDSNLQWAPTQRHDVGFLPKKCKEAGRSGQAAHHTGGCVSNGAVAGFHFQAPSKLSFLRKSKQRHLEVPALLPAAQSDT